MRERTTREALTRRARLPGTLHLSLTRETYQQLGVPGAPAPVARGAPLAGTAALRRAGRSERGAAERADGPPRYGAALHLTRDSFQPGRRHYERVTQCFRERAAPLRMLLARTLRGCSAELAFPPAAQAQRHAMRPATRRIARLTLPPLAAAFGGDAASAAAAASDAPLLSALHEWLGAVAAGAAGAAQADAVAWRHDDARGGGEGGEGGRYEWPLREGRWAGEPGGWAEAHRWQGLLTPAHVAHAAAAARAAVAARRAPWAAVSVWGFRDAPVAWLPPHPPGGAAPPPPQPRVAGANDFALLLLPQDRWLLLTMETSEA